MFYNYVEVQHPVNQFFEGINGTGRYFSLNSGDSTAHLNFSDNTSSVRVAQPQSVQCPIGGYRHSDTILVVKNGYELLIRTPLALKDLVISR
ncbi:hypothetical protein NW801_20665 [Brevibacillus laterosporus]|uniref:Uncharacterized protein n=1 Tax=Brevibacillus halotolerans TaxID=1507437 RepID=A0ABT4I275_9BACL|nr:MULTISPECIES: hypothetical protein [Brevibacillus]MCR8987418.1 hypothetical protein [Brevibacillus laterosporus]MCZ0833156.1 hypothetical protein [Brevibacillus halotolerans]